MADLSSFGMILFNTSVYGGVSDSYWTVMMEDIAAALHRRGDDCICINPDNPEHIKLLQIVALGAGWPRYLLLFNFAPALARANDPSALGVLGGIKAPYISLFLDHPALLGKGVAEMEAGIAADPSLRPLRHYGLMEREHLAVMDKLGVPASSCFLFPQAGGAPVAEPRPMGLRSIPAIFAGTIEAEVSNQEFCEQMGLKDPLYCRLADEAVSEIMDGQCDVYEIVARLFAGTEIVATTTNLIELIRRLDYRARTLRRHRMFRCLRHLPIQYYGNASDDFKRNNTNIEFMGSIGFRGLLDVMNDTKVMLNDTINLRSSTLIRVFYGMSRGCLVASEVNSFIETEFVTPGAAVAIDYNDCSAGERIMDLVNRPVEAQAMTHKALQIYSGAHTWDHRVTALLDVIPK
ncbi:glycosyltransferase [Magnetospirillum sp. 15-1]|uniref:glycosyltransferase n=1 Tax=Magnetospirillum sp. 15-1 TaxID=1979370 RepID=UPI000BBC5557|nr:glycosyltransferase [Magnetospirillum sp. 15-1]